MSAIEAIIPGVTGRIAGVSGIAESDTAGAIEPGKFSSMLANGLGSVSDLEAAADAASADFAAGGPTQIHEVMATTAKAQLGMQVLVEVRNRAIEAYQQIVNLQV